MMGHSTCMYSSVPVCVVHQQSWLTNSRWRPARSLDNGLFGDASHCSLMTDCGRYTYFSYCYCLSTAPYRCTAQYLVITKHCIFPFILIYLVTNSYIVNKALKCMGAQPPERKQHKMETGGLRENRPGVSITDKHLRSLHRESLRGELSGASGGSNSFAISSSHSVENSLACS